jgi:peptidoglycan hydrolase-like protein with peptidoglycan-binding domain
MGVVTARLVFLAFLGLTGTIIYNALYLQEHAPRGMSSADASTQGVATISVVPKDEPPEFDAPSEFEAPPPAAQSKAPAQPAGMASVSTDLPPLPAETAESQLVVRAVQRELAARGYDVGAVDGNLSDKTRAAISTFQSSEGLTVTGLPSDDLLRQILLGDSVAPAEATGSVTAPDSIAASAAEHETVKSVQQALAELGYAPGPVDGDWGENTARAISAFQRDRNLPQSGQITPELLGEFQRVTGRDVTKTAAHR